ncbi:MAG TPA: DUF4129 domain-containing protein [Candidatus Saccharimonadia bacterium]|nr:DUF4129 domain-containing protein [Candidatus Saccharimonadia bacterium]
MPKASTRDHRELFSMVEEGTHLLRRAPVGLWLLYYVGSVPFVLYLFYFWSDMSRSGFAERRLLESSLILALLYAFMKVTQAWFCDGLMGIVQGREQRDRMPLRGWLRLIVSQMWVHATAPWVLAISLISLLPLPWTYAFYHNVTVMAVDHFRRGGRLKELLAKSMAQSQWQFLQQLMLLALLKVAAILVYLNVVVGFLLVMMLAKSFSGTENAISMSANGSLVMSTPVQGLFFSLCYLAMNPLVKSIYVLRCFYGAARRSGADIEVRLRALRSAGATLVGLAVLLCGGMLQAADAGNAPALAEKAPTVSSDRLERSIRDTLQESEFEWRMPREGMKGEQDDSLLGNTMRGLTDWLNASLEDIGKALGDLIDWIMGGKESEDFGDGSGMGSAAGAAWVGFMPMLLLILGIALVVALAWLLFRHWRQVKQTVVVDTTAVPEINLENENIVATQLPENEWLRLAREKMEAGDYRLALRALFLATLAHLGDKRLLHISRTKSNGDYVHELGWRAKGRADLNESFHQQVRTFDRVWYGWHDVSLDLMTRFQEQHERITTHAT